MKAFTTILFICLFPVIAFSQNSPEENIDKEQSGQKEEKHGFAKEILDEDNVEGEKSAETKSFTLDANDAVLEEKVVTEEPEIEKPNVPGTTTYHYNNYRKNDDIQTLAGKHSHHGGFGAISFRASEFNNKDIIMAGFRGGWIGPWPLVLRATELFQRLNMKILILMFR